MSRAPRTPQPPRLAAALGGTGREAAEAFRLLLRRPLWAALVAGSLAVGLAAFAAAVSVGDALFLSALPGVADPAGLVRPILAGGASYLELRALARGEVRSLSDAAGFADRLFTVRPGEGGAEGERLLVLLASERYFPLLGVRMARGRGWSDAEAAAGAPLVVISHHYWQRRLGGDPAVIGRTLRVQGEPFTVVGVAPAGFAGTFRGFGFDLWLPLATAPRLAPGLDLGDPALRRLELVGRLAPGATIATATAELRVAVRRLRPGEEAPSEVMPLTGFDEEVRKPALALVGVLLALGTLVLLVTVANAAGVLIARAVVRRRELAVRAALGASRAQVVRLLFWESLLVAGSGALLGAFGSTLLGRLLLASLAALPARLALDLKPGPRALLVLAGVTVVCTLLLAVLSARDSRGGSLAMLRGGRGGAGRDRLRSALVVGQVAAASALLLLAGFFVHALRTSDRGPALEPVLAAPFLDRVSLRLDDPAARVLMREVEARVAALPGVSVAALAERAPVPGGQTHDLFRAEEVNRGEPGTPALVTRVTAGYFSALGIAWREGRWVNDREEGTEEAVLDATLARRLWPRGSAIGRRVRFGDELLTVTGVVADLPGPTGDPRPTLYRGFLRKPPVRLALLVRCAPGAVAGRVAAAVRADLERAVPGLGPVDLSPLRDLRRLALLPQRMAAGAGSLLGGVGLLVAAVGLYALLALIIAQRRRDLAVRAALGARPSALLRAVVGRALCLVGAGYALGGGLVLAAGRALPAGRDGTLALGLVLAVGIVLALTTAAAAALPALNAWRVDPCRALRED